MSKVSAGTVADFLPLIEILAKAGLDAVGRRENRDPKTMTLEEIKIAAARLSNSIKPWDEPIEGETK